VRCSPVFLAPFLLPRGFHPPSPDGSSRTFDAPTPAQSVGLRGDRGAASRLSAAPTGSGKTSPHSRGIDDWCAGGVAAGGLLPDQTWCVCVALKALSNDIHRNLEAPRAGIRAELRRARSAEWTSHFPCAPATRRSASAWPRQAPAPHRGHHP